MTGPATTAPAAHAAHAALTSLIIESILQRIKDGSGVLDACNHTITHMITNARSQGYTPAALATLQRIAVDTATELIINIDHALVRRDGAPAVRT